MQRIETFLNEDEVDEQVSSIKRTQMGASAPTFDEFGLKNASFKWNAVKEEEKMTEDTDKSKKGKDATLNGSGSTNGSSGTGHGPDIEAAAAIASALTDESDRKFELKDISVIFPEGELSVITGPTASGKTAMLVCILFNFYRSLRWLITETWFSSLYWAR